MIFNFLIRCEKPINCPKPKCELKCDKPACGMN